MRQVFKVVMTAVLMVLLSLGSVARGFAQGGEGRPFITKWQGKAGEELKIPIVGTEYKLVIKDAQGKVVKSEEKVTVTGKGEAHYHTFTPEADGVYTVEAGPAGVRYMQTGEIFGSFLASSASLLEVVQFGTVAWESMSAMFYKCNNMIFAADIDTPNLTKVTDMSSMFCFCGSFNQPLEKWDVSKVTDMFAMFYGCTAFNQPLEKWDVSKVTSMRGMFAGCSSFNQPLEKWDVSQVTSMSEMFYGCSAFNQPLEKWDVSQVTGMNLMFCGCSAFNQPLEKWNVSQVTGMNLMFNGCTAFNQPLEKWDVSNVTKMEDMFKGCSAFNQPLGAWKLRTAIGGLSTTAMSVENYSLSLIGWAKQTDGASNISFGEEVKGLVYNDAGREARAKLIARGWTFEGDVFYQLSEKVAITLQKEGEGTIAIEGYNEAALQAVAVGTELTVIATPKDGYSLTSLTAGTQDILATKKFTVTGAVTVKAVFTKNGGSNPGGGSTTFAITLAKEGEGTLAIEGYNDESLQAVAVGTELTVIATPKEGYTLTSLTVGTQDILATKKFTVTGAVTVKAVFKKKGNNGGGNNGGGNSGGGNTQTPQAVEDAVLASLSVIPNPFSSQLRIDNPEGITARYELVNASGLVVRFGSFSATEVLVDTEALPAGVYFVLLEAQNGAKKVVKVIRH